MKFLRQDIERDFGFSVAATPTLRAKLDQNECGRDLPGEIRDMIREELARTRLNRYPQPKTYYEIKEPFAEAAGFRPENLFITVGCDQVILMAYWLAGGPGRKALIFEPTYPMFGHAAMITATRADRINLGPEFRWDTSLFSGGYHIISIVSPNNPTGQLAEDRVVEAGLETGALVMADEAYFDFSGKTYAGFLKDYDNLLVGRSLSKSGLAGIRLGFGVARPEIVSLAEHLLFVPYHLNALQLAVARLYPRIKPTLTALAEDVNQQKQRLYKFFERQGIPYNKSYGNFVLFSVAEPERVYQALLDEGVRIRNTSVLPGLRDWLRVTVGTAEEMDCFMDALARAL